MLGVLFERLPSPDDAEYSEDVSIKLVQDCLMLSQGHLAVVVQWWCSGGAVVVQCG